MNAQTMRYSLQLRPVEVSQQSEDGVLELEFVAEPEGAGQPIRGRFRQWHPIFERLCTLLSSSPFHRKVMQRSLRAGVPMHVLDRTNGTKLMFSEEQIASLALDRSNAA